MKPQAVHQSTEDVGPKKHRRGHALIAISLLVIGAIGIILVVQIYLSRQAVYQAAQDEYAIVQSLYLTTQSEKPSERASLSQFHEAQLARVDISALQSLNADCVGWIEIPDTAISYPIVQGSNNAYYLTHTFQKTQNKAGAIFMDYRCATDFSDMHTILFGHNMRDGSMFASLDQYQDASFLALHPIVHIHLADRVLVYRIVLAKQIAQSNRLFSAIASLNDVEAIQKALAVVLAQAADFDENGTYITLSTCVDNGDSAARDIIIAKLESIVQ